MIKKDEEATFVGDTNNILISKPDGPPAIKKSCPDLYVYNPDDEKCMQCPRSVNYGYIRDTKTCGTCQGTDVYDLKTRSCIPCPCGSDCSKLES